MKNAKKTIVFIILLSIISITLIVFRYETLLKEAKKENQFFAPVKNGQPTGKEYTAEEIIKLIKESKDYLGDTITIFDNGEMKTSNAKFQGTINAVISSKDNMEMVKLGMADNKLPLQYNIYNLAAVYYKQQYPGEFSGK